MANINKEILTRLLQEGKSVAGKISSLEESLTSQNLETQKEIYELLKKQEEISKNFEFITSLDEIEDLVLDEQSAEMQKLKNREQKHKQVRMGYLQSMIGNSKSGLVKYKEGTNLYDSYLDNLNYYQKQLDHLISGLEL